MEKLRNFFDQYKFVGDKDFSVHLNFNSKKFRDDKLFSTDCKWFQRAFENLDFYSSTFINFYMKYMNAVNTETSDFIHFCCPFLTFWFFTNKSMVFAKIQPRLLKFE